MALDVIIQELKTNRWIPADEKLPKRDEKTQNLSKHVQLTVKDEFGIGIDIGHYNYKNKQWRTILWLNY